MSLLTVERSSRRWTAAALVVFSLVAGPAPAWASERSSASRMLLRAELTRRAPWENTVVSPECFGRGISFESPSPNWVAKPGTGGSLEAFRGRQILGHLVRTGRRYPRPDTYIDVFLGRGRYVPDPTTLRRSYGLGWGWDRIGRIPNGSTTAFRFRGCPYVLEGFGMTPKAFEWVVQRLEPAHHYLSPDETESSVFVITPRGYNDFRKLRRIEVGVRGRQYLTTALRELFDRTRPRYYWNRTPLYRDDPRIPIRSVSVVDGEARIDFDRHGFHGNGTSGAAWWTVALTQTVFQFQHITSIRLTSDGSCHLYFGLALHDGMCPPDELIHRSDPYAG